MRRAAREGIFIFRARRGWRLGIFFQQHLGESAALCTALVWSFTAIFFTLASERVGALVVNRTRLVMAVLLLSLTHVVLLGEPLPVHAGWRAWMWLSLSGFVGLALGDSFLFQSFVDLGTRKAMLVASSWPIFSALLAFLFLGESLSLVEVAGIVLTTSGIAWVVLERGGEGSGRRPSRLGRGVLFAALAALCQAAGIVIAKEGLSGGLPPLSGTLIRMAAATVGLWAATAAAGRAGGTLAKLKDRRGMLFTTAGAMTGPFLGVWMSLVAVSHAKVGVASAIMSLVPVLLIPLVRIFFEERVTFRAAAGTLLSFIGVLLLFIK